MPATATPSLLDADQALLQALELVDQGHDTSEAAMTVLDAGVTDDALRALAITGLAKRVNDRLGDQRAATLRSYPDTPVAVVTPPAPKRRGQVAATHPARELWLARLEAKYVTASGSKRVLDFTLGDTRELIGRFEAAAATFQRRGRAFRMAELALLNHRVDRIGELPQEELAVIAQALP